MSVDTATPTGSAATVGDRYRLVECVAGDPDGPASAWRAWDNLLNRPVTLTLVSPGGGAAGGFLSHAHAVSTIAHPSLARVYDAVDEGDRAYVVSEWVSGTSFTALLRDGALDADSAAGTVARVADGVAVAHAAGIAFGGVHPDHVVVTADGGVKLAQVVGDGRAATGDDVRGLGALLYGALTAHWPLAATGGAAGLRQATTSSGHLLSPRQVRAGVPEDLSTLAVRALDQGGPQGLHSAAAMAAVLTERAGPQEDPFAFEPDDRPQRRRPRWLALAIPVTAGLSVLALIGWLVGTALGGLNGRDGGGNVAEASGPTATSAAPVAPKVVKPQTATLLDPEGDRSESTAVDRTLDGDPATAWQTQTYKRNARFGNLKRGMGVEYEFAAATPVSQVTITTGRPGSKVQILAGPDANPTSVVGEGTLTGPSSKISVRPQTSARYYVVWITDLAEAGPNQFKADLAEVTFAR